MAFYDKVALCWSSCLCLKLCFLWPLKKEEINPPKWFYLRFAIFAFITFTTCLIPVVIHLVKAWGKDIDISEDLSVIAAYTGLHSLMIVYIIQQKDIFKLIRALSDFRTYGKPKNFDKTNKKLNFITMGVYIYAFIGTVFYNGIKIMQMPQCKKERGYLEVCGVIISIWMPFEVSSHQKLVFVALYEFMLIVIANKITVLVSMQLLEMTINIKLRIDQLNLMFLDWFDGDTKSSRQRLVRCIRYHTLIIEHAKHLNDYFTHGMFIHISTTGIICGCLENQIVKVQEPGAIIHILGWIMSLFVACLAGQILMDSVVFYEDIISYLHCKTVIRTLRSCSVLEAVYGSKWYEADFRLQKDLLLIIQRSQQPLFIKAGPYNFLCFTLFVAIMKMSYSILTLLN